MKPVKDHPVTASLLRSGCPDDSYSVHPEDSECPFCGGAQTNWVFELEGEYVCRDCFCDWVKDYVTTNPKEVAVALAVKPMYVG